jgi:hypothetical protein
MNAIARIVISSLVFAWTLSSATATDLTEVELKDLLSGKSIYVQTTAASAAGTAGQGVLYYAADGHALYKTPTGAIWHGAWVVNDNAICSVWKERPSTPCSKYEKQGDTITILNTTNGEVSAEVLKIVAGNAENIAP